MVRSGGEITAGTGSGRGGWGGRSRIEERGEQRCTRIESSDGRSLFEPSENVGRLAQVGIGRRGVTASASFAPFVCLSLRSRSDAFDISCSRNCNYTISLIIYTLSSSTSCFMMTPLRSVGE